MRTITTHLSVACAATALLAGPSHADAGEPRFSVVELSTGVQMHFAEQGPANGEPVILLHGYSDSWFSFSRILPLLPDEFRVYALDMRGHGKSSRPVSGYAMHDLASDVLAFMDAKGLVRATIVGHSMGGFVAQQVALAAPKRVSRLVIVSSARTARDLTGIGELEQLVKSLGDPVPPEFALDFQRSTVHAPVPDPFMDAVVKESLRLPARVWHALMQGMLDMKPALSLGRSGIPALVMWGDKDVFAQRSQQDLLVGMLRTARLKEFRDTGHAPQWEMPDAFARELAAFIRATNPVGG